MKKACFFTIFLTFSALFSFVVHAQQSKHLYFEGVAESFDQRNYFLDNFKMEAAAIGYFVEDIKSSAAYTFRFDVSRNVIEYDDGTRGAPPPDEPQYILTITLTSNEDGTELVSFGFPYSTLDEMYEYNQLLLVRTVSNIPAEEEGEVTDDSWRNKWLYVRASFDFPVTFYRLQPTDLVDGIALYVGPYENPGYVMSIDNRIIAQPGLTFGFEVQFMSWKHIGLSAEPKFQIGWEYLNNLNFFTMAAGLDLKFPLKFIKHVMLEPYGSVVYHLPVDLDIPISSNFSTVSKIFDLPPQLGVGGGFQLGIKAGRLGVAFVDVNYMVYIDDVRIINNYKFQSAQTEPKVIHYQRSAIGLGIGYKFGFIDRKPRAAAAE